MADRGDPDADQVFGGQLRQHLAVDIIVAERRYIALKAQILQPRRYVHAVILRSEKRKPLVDDDMPLPSGLPAVALKCRGVGVLASASERPLQSTPAAANRYPVNAATGAIPVRS